MGDVESNVTFQFWGLYSIAQALSGLNLAVTVRFSKQKRDLEKILTFIYKTDTVDRKQLGEHLPSLSLPLLAKLSSKDFLGMVTNNIIPLHFKTRAQKGFFSPLKEGVLVTGWADIKNIDATIGEEDLFSDLLSPGHEDTHLLIHLISIKGGYVAGGQAILHSWANAK